MNAITLKRHPFAGMMPNLPRIALTRDSMGPALGAAILFGTIIGAAQGFASGPVAAQVAPPAPPSMAVQAIAPEAALTVNKEIPLASGPNPPATAFRMTGASAGRAQAVECLASAAYYEAASEGEAGEQAVAQVVLNRVRHPAFPASVCGVVYQGSTRATGCQFSFTCDGSLARQPDASGWRRAKSVAEAALKGQVYAPVGWATHYHANYVVPYWASSLAKNAVVGAHLFYHWRGGWGLPQAFVQKYSAHEASAQGLRLAALAVERDDSETVAVISAEAAVEQLPGVEAIELAPSMRGDKRVELRFSQTARKAADEAVHKDYGETFRASDNLRWTLSNDSAGSAEQPLGKAAPPPPAKPTGSGTATGIGGASGAVAVQR
ncbi:MAG: cell wall hydrolase [Sphingomicrobium sp.]